MGTQLPPPKKKGHSSHPRFAPCLLGPNGWMDVCARWEPIPSKRHISSLIFGPCPLWPKGWMDPGTIWYGGRPRPRPHCIRWGTAASQNRYSYTTKIFIRLSVVAKRLDGLRYYLLLRYTLRSKRHCVRWGPSTPTARFSAHVYCGQTAA